MTKNRSYKERYDFLKELNELTEGFLNLLGFMWVALVLWDFYRGLSTFSENLLYIIWSTFILDFILEIAIAPDKIKYLKNNALNLISLLIPASRLFRLTRGVKLVRTFKTVRSVKLATLVSSMNRSIRTIRATLDSSKFLYVLSLTITLTVLGAAGMAYFESPQALAEAGISRQEDGFYGLSSYGDALWYTAMLMTTIGSGYWPVTMEGRILTLILSIYALGILGYITATIASYLLKRR